MDRAIKTSKRNERITGTSLIVCLCLLVLARPSFAENVRHFPAPTVTSGIPDHFVYCLILQAMAMNNDILHRARLSPSDEMTAAEIIEGFENRFQKQSDAFDRRLLTREEFTEKRDSLVQATRTQLNAKLSPPGSARLDAFIRDQKAKIRATQPIVFTEN